MGIWDSPGEIGDGGGDGATSFNPAGLKGRRGRGGGRGGRPKGRRRGVAKAVSDEDLFEDLFGGQRDRVAGGVAGRGGGDLAGMSAVVVVVLCCVVLWVFVFFCDFLFGLFLASKRFGMEVFFSRVCWVGLRGIGLSLRGGGGDLAGVTNKYSDGDRGAFFVCCFSCCSVCFCVAVRFLCFLFSCFFCCC